MSPSRTRFVGMDVPKDSLRGAYVPHDHGAASTSLGSLGTRPPDSAQMLRTRPSKATPLLFVSAAGPWGSWLSRSLPTKGDDCWVGAPALSPTKPGDRGPTDRRDAVHLARLARAGDRTVVYVPTVAEAARRDLPRARDDPSSELQAATCRLKAFLLRQDRRYVGRPQWARPPCAGSLQSSVPPRRSPAACKKLSGPCVRPPSAASGLNKHAKIR